MQKMSDLPLKKCPDCGGKLLKKLSATAFQLKGGGWYKDGYSSSNKKEKGGGQTESKPEGSKGSGSETKKVVSGGQGEGSKPKTTKA